MASFFDAETYAAKMNVAATGFPRKTTPGTQWVYHTSDTFMLGRAQHQYLKTQQGSSADIFTMLRDDVLKPIKTSPESWASLRTDNSATGQAFAGYGMFWTQDNIAKVARLLNNDNGKSPTGTQLLSTAVLDASMQKNASDRGLDTGNGFKYNNGSLGQAVHLGRRPELHHAVLGPVHVRVRRDHGRDDAQRRDVLLLQRQQRVRLQRGGQGGLQARADDRRRRRGGGCTGCPADRQRRASRQARRHRGPRPPGSSTTGRPSSRLARAPGRRGSTDSATPTPRR